MHSNTLKTCLERLLIAIVFFVILGPFFWCLLLSLQGSREINSTFALLIPAQLHPENYRAVLLNSRWVSGFLNSLWISLASVAVNLLFSMPAGYALARVRFPMKGAIHQLLLMLIFLPPMLLVVPLRQMFAALHLQNTIWATALPLSAMVFSTLIFRQFYSRFPQEIDDCATLMGMGPIHRFWKIYAPVSGRTMLYTSMLHFISTWNCLFIPLFMYREPHSLVTVQEALLQFAMNPSRIYLGMAAVDGNDRYSFSSLDRSAALGADIAANIPQLARASRLLACQQEYYDGSGCHGLRGEKIPLACRIFTTAMIFDELQHGVRHLGSEEALEELRLFSGTLLDPDIVNAFNRLHTDKYTAADVEIKVYSY